MLYRVHLVCPHCGKHRIAVSEKPNPRVRCSHCLQHNNEIVEMKIFNIRKMETENG